MEKILRILPVDGVIDWIQFWFAKGDAYVIEVKGYRDASISYQSAPESAMAMYVSDNNDAATCQMVQQRIIWRLEIHNNAHFIGISLGNLCPDTSCLQSLTFPGRHALGTYYNIGMLVIGDSHQQMQVFPVSVPLPPSQPQVQLLVGIELFCLVHHIRQKVEGKGRMNPVTTTITETQQPDQRISEQQHRQKGLKTLLC